MFETIDKLALVKNKKNLAKDALIAQAKKGTKRNILIGLAVGALALVVGHFTDKKLIPFNERMYDKLEAQEKELQEFEEFKKQRDAQKPAAEVVNNVEGETSVEKKD